MLISETQTRQLPAPLPDEIDRPIEKMSFGDGVNVENAIGSVAVRPTISAGDSMLPSMNALESILDIIDTEDDLEFIARSKVLIEQRLSYLESSSVPQNITYEANPVFEGFISSESVVFPNVFEADDAPGFMLNDPEIYSVLMDCLRHKMKKFKAEGKDISDERVKKTLLVGAVQRALIDYFGDDSEAEAKHESKFVLDVGADDQKMRYNLDEFKGSAMCVEFAAAGNNMLQFLDFKGVRLIFGSVRSGGDHAKKEHHAFLVVEGSDGVQKIFDPIKPSAVHDLDKKKLEFRKLAIYPSAEAILSGGELTVTRVDHVKKHGVTKVLNQQFTYSAR